MPKRLPPHLLRKASDVAGALPRLSYNALRHGLLPWGWYAAKTAQSEGLSEIHWKVLGDGLVRFLRESGPVLTKVGQILATRSDLLPAPLCQRLEALYSEQPALPEREVRRILKQVYKQRSPFADFEMTPLAVGSIGQVHRAKLQSGEEVIVKILRPRVRREIDRDVHATQAYLNILFLFPRKERRFVKEMMRRALNDLAEGLRMETDLRNEAKSLEGFRKKLANHSKVVIPKVFQKISKKEILVMEELKGIPLSQVRTKADAETAKKVADLALTEILKQVFEDGRFHADPHGGNLLLLEDGRLGLIDLGLTGEFTAKDRKTIARAVKAFVARDADRLIETLLEFGELPPEFKREPFKKEIVQTVQQYRKESRVGLESFVNELFAVAYRHGIYLPSQTTLLIKTLVTIEGVARSLDPEINLAMTALPVVLRSLTPRWLKWLTPSR